MINRMLPMANIPWVFVGMRIIQVAYVAIANTFCSSVFCRMAWRHLAVCVAWVRPAPSMSSGEKKRCLASVAMEPNNGITIMAMLRLDSQARCADN